MTQLPEARAAITAALERRAAQRAQQLRNAIVLELSSAGTGRTYTHYYAIKGGRLVPVGKRNKPHTASAPDEAPAVDSGRLRQSITALHVGEGRWRVGTNAFYAIYLEFGTRRMAARPFIRPALEKVMRAGTRSP